MKHPTRVGLEVGQKLRFHFALDQTYMASIEGRLRWMPSGTGDCWIIEATDNGWTRLVYIQQFVFMEVLDNGPA